MHGFRSRKRILYQSLKRAYKSKAKAAVHPLPLLLSFVPRPFTALFKASGSSRSYQKCHWHFLPKPSCLHSSPSELLVLVSFRRTKKRASKGFNTDTLATALFKASGSSRSYQKCHWHFLPKPSRLHSSPLELLVLVPSVAYQKTRVARLSFFGTPEGTRTPDLLVRSQTLYPTELPARAFVLN